MVYEKISGPLGHRRGDIQAATIAAAVVNANKGKKGRPAKISDFLIPYDKRRKTPDEMLSTLTSLTRKLGGTIS